MNAQKYEHRFEVTLPNRQWPKRKKTSAPKWCSVDMRDGNQALAIPMNIDEKLKLYQTLLKIGFKEIEVGFPAASQSEYDFLSTLVERNLIPDDGKVQVLIQCREHLIDRTFEANQGIRNVIVQIYNSTSVLQRHVVFHKD